MPLDEPLGYRFERKTHWALCGLDGFAPDVDELTAGGGGVWRPLTVAAADRSALAIAAAPGGALTWLRRSGELVGADEEGRFDILGALGGNDLSGGGRGGDMHLAVDGERIWLVSEGRLRVHHLRYLQLLRESPVRPVLSLFAERTGAWCLVETGQEVWSWTHFGASGAPDRPEVPWEEGRAPLGGTFDPCSSRFLVLDTDGLWSRRPCDSLWSLEVDLCPFRCRFEPDRICVDCQGRIHLLDRGRGLIWSYAGKGVRIAQRKLPGGEVRLSRPEGSITAGRTIAIATPMGIYRLDEPADTRSEVRETEPREAVLVTPTLTSPREGGGSWQRARINAHLPPGTTLRVRIASSGDDRLRDQVAEMAARPELSATQRLMEVDRLLPWDESRETTLALEDDPLDLGLYEVLLDGVTEPYLWLSIHMHVPPTSRAGVLRCLEVRYPASSWIEDLPAVYRAEPARAADLRRFLAAFEMVFDGLEERIAKLPWRLSPSETDEIWLHFLLQWLGLRLPADLPVERKGNFLQEAPELLRRRGSLWALQRALQTVTGRVVRVRDYGAESLPWVLNADGVRLGRDTLLIRQGRVGFSLGRAAKLGRDGLGPHLAGVEERVAQRTLALRIEIEGATSDAAADEASIEAVLDYFLPAACRYAIRRVPERPRQRRSLGRDARLARPSEAGRVHELGRAALAGGRYQTLRLDHRARLDGSRQLS